MSYAEKLLCKGQRPCHPDVLGYHVRSDIPNYWNYPREFVLQDHFFEAPGSWSLQAGQ
jgi:phospholipase C